MMHGQKNVNLKYSTCFGQVHCPSSGVSQHCVHAVGICHANSDKKCISLAFIIRIHHDAQSSEC